jgi:hypothetical protein
MKYRNGNLRHVASETVPGRVDPAGGLRITLSGMTGQAFCLVDHSRPFIVAVRVVTSQARESATAFGVASAERKGQAGRANKSGIIRRAFDLSGATHGMAIGALGYDCGRRCGPGVNDCPVRETSFDRRQMVPARPVTPFATNAGIGRRGTDSDLRQGVAEISKVGHVAVNTADDTVAHGDLFATNVFERIGVGNVARGSSPADGIARVVRGEPKRAIVSLLVPTNHRHVALTHAEGIFDDAFKNAISIASLDLDAILIALERVRDPGTVGVGQWMVGKG